MNSDEMMEEHQCDACLHADSVSATDQELVAGVLIALLYVQGLDLSVGDAGTVLVEGGRSTQVRHARQDMEEEDEEEKEWGGGHSLGGGWSGRGASIWEYVLLRGGLSEVVNGEGTRVMITGNKEAADWLDRPTRAL